MKNKNVGLIIIGIAIIIGVITFIFNTGLRSIISSTCSHGSSCSMYSSVSIETWISLSLAFIIAIIGVIIMFVRPEEKVIIKTLKEKRKKINTEGLDNNEKKVIEILQNENGAIFQSSLMERLGIGKVGITRLLDKLEAKQLIERKRRGMNNIVVLKN
jgi:uncharacterized membrane protein